jgi:phospholipid/cholesterol/gamma-HCH transport system ATP-binding protein
MTTAIEISSLKKSFDGGHDFVLKGIDLSIPKGAITMIIGFSGTGKSVLMKHILGIMKPTSGSVKVLGKDLSQMNRSERLKFRINLGVMFQYSALFDDMTALENVIFPMFEHRKDMTREEMTQKASQKLEQAGFSSKHFDKLPAEMSGGMRKRVGLARALALDPEVLLYDEPTTGLDPILTEMVDDLIYKTHHSNKGHTSVVISHDLHAAFRIGDHVVMLHEGGVLKEGAPEEFLNSTDPLIQKFVNTGVRKKEHV